MGHHASDPTECSAHSTLKAHVAVGADSLSLGAFMVCLSVVYQGMSLVWIFAGLGSTCRTTARATHMGPCLCIVLLWSFLTRGRGGLGGLVNCLLDRDQLQSRLSPTAIGLPHGRCCQEHCVDVDKELCRVDPQQGAAAVC